LIFSDLSSSNEEMSVDEDEIPAPVKANDEKKAFGSFERPPFEAKEFRRKLFGRNGGTGKYSIFE